MKRRIDYYAYMASREWALKKRQVRERAHECCERCKMARLDQIHHLTYERLGQELLSDLLGVCRPCHEYLSAISDYDPLPAAEEHREALREWRRRQEEEEKRREELQRLHIVCFCAKCRGESDSASCPADEPLIRQFVTVFRHGRADEK